MKCFDFTQNKCNHLFRAIELLVIGLASQALNFTNEIISHFLTIFKLPILNVLLFFMLTFSFALNKAFWSSMELFNLLAIGASGKDLGF
jgi:hypothetical protein